MTDPDDLAMEIEGLFAAATDNPCTCGSDPEGWCRYCAAWDAAHKKTAQLLREAAAGRLVKLVDV
jgi:hypothetical protein